MPLTIVPLGKEVIITKCHLEGELKRHMENLGLLPGERITLIAEKNGDLIIRVRESRLAINKSLALKIHVN